jgi:tRNA threonylcarbamoyladenosine biosynthesis protein TsaB
MSALIVFDTSTERTTVALMSGGRVLACIGNGGAQASATLLPAIFRVLAEAGLALGDLDAIAFGRGPGAFTGLRTACAVAQGLAFGAGKRVLPIDTLLAVAEDARDDAARARVWALLDARMDQIYAAEYAYADGRWTTRTAPFLTDCDALAALWRDTPPELIAGNAIGVFGARLQTANAVLVPAATPSALALLRLAETAWTDGAAIDPALALPLYVRDKVAETEAERALRKGPRRGPPRPLGGRGAERGGSSPESSLADQGQGGSSPVERDAHGGAPPRGAPS